jgi:spore maturation protein CgeB
MSLDAKSPVSTAGSRKGAILYLGTDSGTSLHRAAALRRLGYDVTIVNPRRVLPTSPLMNQWMHHTGALFLGRYLADRISAMIPQQPFDLVWVDGGNLVSASLVQQLKKRYGTVINYNLDDPYGKRDGKKWRHYLGAVSSYDLVVVVREANVLEARQLGAKDVMLVDRSADEIAHARRELTPDDLQKWSSEVVFIGTWMPERGPFLSEVVRRGVPLTIYGARWDRAPEWEALKPYWRGPGLYIDEEYSKALQCAKVCIGLLSVGNRDDCTQRSFEVPYLGSVLCAQRTGEHLRLYREGSEAVFWSTAAECAQKCAELLENPGLRAEIAAAGRARCLENETTNEKVLSKILHRVTRNRDAAPKVEDTLALRS